MTVSVVYLSQADIARELSVTPSAITTMRSRHDNFPAPDVIVGSGKHAVPGWLPGRMYEIHEWNAFRPGQGAGGGRPRKA